MSYDNNSKLLHNNNTINFIYPFIMKFANISVMILIIVISFPVLYSDILRYKLFSLGKK